MANQNETSDHCCIIVISDQVVETFISIHLFIIPLLYKAKRTRKIRGRNIPADAKGATMADRIWIFWIPLTRK